MCNRVLRVKDDKDGAVPESVKMLGDRVAKELSEPDISFNLSREIGRTFRREGCRTMSHNNTQRRH
jgi:hypothetical protein